MKRLLLIALALATVGGAFAQGHWDRDDVHHWEWNERHHAYWDGFGWRSRDEFLRLKIVINIGSHPRHEDRWEREERLERERREHERWERERERVRERWEREHRHRDWDRDWDRGRDRDRDRDHDWDHDRH